MSRFYIISLLPDCPLNKNSKSASIVMLDVQHWLSASGSVYTSHINQTHSHNLIVYFNEFTVNMKCGCHEWCMNRAVFCSCVNVATVLVCFSAVIQQRYEWAASISINSWHFAKHSETNQLHTIHTPPHYSTANTPLIMMCYGCYDMNVG